MNYNTASIRPTISVTRTIQALIMLFLLFALHACAYRVAPPHQLAHGISIHIVENQARLVHSQNFLRHAIASEIERELGWQIHPQTSINNLLITVSPEDINEAAHDSQKISSRWRHAVHIQVKFTSPYLANGSISKSFTGHASNSTLNNENNALQAASENLARDLRNWLDTIEFQEAPAAP